jgi:serine/threonine-protein kinase
MGVVVQAIHPAIEKRVAIKVLRRDRCESTESTTRFLNEARAVNQIGHPAIVDVFGFGTMDDGRAYMVMELLAGESLAVRLRRSMLSVAETCHILVEVTHALESAHRAGIVHRDLKPDNLFLTGPTRVKLLDFGIAKMHGDASGSRTSVDHTQPGTFLGTPRYIAPEQARCQPLDGRTDVYALGVVAFEMLTGRTPFSSTDPVELAAKHITLPPPAPSDFVADLPRLADQLIGEMLEKDPENRPSLARVRELLQELCVAPPSTTAHQIASKRRMATDILGLQSETRPRSRTRWLTGGLAALVIGGGAWIAISMGNRSDSHGDQTGGSSASQSAPLSQTVVPPPVAASPSVVEPPASGALDPTRARADHAIRPQRARKERRVVRPVLGPAPPQPASASEPQNDDALIDPFRHRP